MIVQACINGARPSNFHPTLPLTIHAMAHDSAACIAAGAAELHVHPRDANGQESLAAQTIDATILAIRESCPGTLVGVSTGEWIEGNLVKTLSAINSWNVLPDYASVNLSEAGAEEVMEQLDHRGVGIEVGLASAADAELFASFKIAPRAFRILIEINEQDSAEALEAADNISAILKKEKISKSVLLHGFDATIWQFVKLAGERLCSTRIGLEDGRTLPDGTAAAGNVAMVKAALNLWKEKS